VTDLRLPVAVFLVCLPLASWLIYPLFLLLATILPNRKKDIKEVRCRPVVPLRVCVLVAAFNEELTIAQRIENLNAQNLPDHLKLDIKVLSDGSTDRTDEIISAYGGVELVSFCRVGRATMHVHAMTKFKHEYDYFIFTDSETTFEIDLVDKLISEMYRSGSLLGTCALRYKNMSSTPVARAESIYWRYESTLRKLEQRVGLNLSSTGAAMAISSQACFEMCSGEDIDTSAPIYVKHMLCEEVTYISNAIAYDNANIRCRENFRSKVRGVTQTVMCWRNQYLSRKPWRSPLLGIHFLFHRVLRYNTLALLVVALGGLAALYGAQMLYRFAVLMLAFVFSAGFRSIVFSIFGMQYGFLLGMLSFTISIY